MRLAPAVHQWDRARAAGAALLVATYDPDVPCRLAGRQGGRQHKLPPAWERELRAALGPLLGAEGLKGHNETCRACRGLPMQLWHPRCRQHYRDELDRAIRRLGGASLELHDLRRALGGRGRDD